MKAHNLHTEKLQYKLDDDEFDLMAVVARKLWSHKNSLINGGDFIHPSQLVKMASESLGFCRSDRRARNQQNTTAQPWKAPTWGDCIG